MRVRSATGRRGTAGRLSVGMALTVLLTLLVGAGTLVAGELQPAQEEFIPIDQLPSEDQLPAAPLLVGAYALVWLLVFGYLWSIWCRLSSVERELRELSNRSNAHNKRSS